METNHNNIEELSEIAPVVAGLSKQNLYFVPGNYFDSLAESILGNIRLAQLKEVPNPYSVPAGYFENLADSILNKIHLRTNEVYEELSEVAPLLNTISKSNIFSVPEGYFEKLSVPVSREAKSAKVISIGSHIRKWVTYAAAASVLFIIATTAYLYVDLHGRSFEHQLPVEQRISELNEQEIMNYLKDNDGITSGDFTPAAEEQDPEIQNLLKTATDEDIQNYLDEYSDPDEQPAQGI